MDVRAEFQIVEFLKIVHYIKKLQREGLNLPKPQQLPERNKNIPHFFIGDEAFALTTNLMKAFPGNHEKGSRERVYNYRLCRARRVVENAFGISSAVFRVLRKPMLLQPDKASLVVLAIVHLHNFLRRNSQARNIYSPSGSLDCEIDGNVTSGSWRNEENMTSLLSLTLISRKSALAAKEIREKLANYFMNEGRLIWQDNY